jgi:hypothetical protein
MATPETKIDWNETEERALREVGATRESGLGKLVIGQRDINAKLFKAITLILEAIADPNNPNLQKAADLVKEVPGRIPPGCSDPH